VQFGARIAAVHGGVHCGQEAGGRRRGAECPVWTGEFGSLGIV
jgi:hypothetical protein